VEDEEIRDRMSRANIKPIYLSRTLVSLGTHGEELRKYLMSPEYLADRKSGMGTFIHGKGDRVFALPVLAKEMVLRSDGVRVQSMRELVNLLNAQHEYLTKLERVPALCISNFQQDGIECPYSYSERSYVEQFLSDRLEQGRRLYLSSCKRLQENVWWSAEFRDLLKPYVREFSFGR